MTYATIDNLKAAMTARDLALLSDLDGPEGVSPDDRLQQALDDATAEIHGYIAGKVSLPLADPPDMLRVVCRDLAVFRLYANLSAITETQTKLRDSAIAYLRAVRDGKVALGDETGAASVEAGEGVVMSEGPDRVMTRDSLKRF